MENVVVLLCKRGVHTAGVILTPSLRFAGLLVILKQKWSDLNEGSFSLYYALEGHPNCILASDDDLNVETKHKNHLIGLFNRAAYAPNVVIFDNLIAELKEGGGDKVISFLRDLPNDNWCHAHFPGKRYGKLTSNLVESFNNWIKDERHLPVTQLLDCIRLKLIEQMSNWRVCAMKWNGVCLVMDKKLAAAFNFSRSWTVTTSHANLFEVRCNPSVSVDIGLRTCSYGEWQINSFPCVHAVCALKKSGKNLNEYVDRYYFVDMYREAYSKCINPVPTLSKADFVPTSDGVLLPPLTKRPPGRPRTKGFRPWVSGQGKSLVADVARLDTITKQVAKSH